MVDCDYCSDDFDSEEEYLDHVRKAHTRDEVSNIDERKIDNKYNGFKTDERELPTEKIILAVGGLAFLAFLAIVAYTMTGLLGGGPSGGNEYPSVDTEPYGQAHFHGQFSMTVTGTQVDFSQNQYQLQDDEFHFEAGNGERWHAHANRVTLKFALTTLGMEPTQDSITYEGTTYTTENYTINYHVNGEQVDISEYTLSEGDAVSIEVIEN